MEYSLWSCDIEEEIIPLCRKIGIGIATYSQPSCLVREFAMLEEQKGQPKEPANTVTPPSPPQPAPTRSPKMSTNFSDLMAFGGPAPERINGRLAMIGFVAAMGVEIGNGQGVFEQISSGGIPLFLGTSLLLSVASLVPLFQGVSVESKSKGLFFSDAELWNGRFAMLGLIALAFTEYVKGSTLV